MKNASRNQSRRAARTTTLRDSLEAKLLKVCADIGWICGLRKERLAPVPAARRTSRKRVMLGRALAAEVEVQEDEAFVPVEIALVSNGRAAQIEATTEVGGLAECAVDLQAELARLQHRSFRASEMDGAIESARERWLRNRLRELRRSML